MKAHHYLISLILYGLISGIVMGSLSAQDQRELREIGRITLDDFSSLKKNPQSLVDHPALSFHRPGQLYRLDEDLQMILWSEHFRFLVMRLSSDWHVFDVQQRRFIYRFRDWMSLLNHPDLGKHFPHRVLKQSELNPDMLEELEFSYSGHIIPQQLLMIRMNESFVYTTRWPGPLFLEHYTRLPESEGYLVYSELLRINKNPILPHHSYSNHFLSTVAHQLDMDMNFQEVDTDFIDIFNPDLTIAYTEGILASLEAHIYLMVHPDFLLSSEALYFRASKKLIQLDIFDPLKVPIYFNEFKQEIGLAFPDGLLVIDSKTGFDKVFHLQKNQLPGGTLIYHHNDDHDLEPYFEYPTGFKVEIIKDKPRALNDDVAPFQLSTLPNGLSPLRYMKPPLRFQVDRFKDLLYLHYPDDQYLTLVMRSIHDSNRQFIPRNRLKKSEPYFAPFTSELSADRKRLITDEWLWPGHFSKGTPVRQSRRWVHQGQHWKELPPIENYEPETQLIYPYTDHWLLVKRDGSVHQVNDEGKIIRLLIPPGYEKIKDETILKKLIPSRKENGNIQRKVKELSLMKTGWSWALLRHRKMPMILDLKAGYLFRYEIMKDDLYLVTNTHHTNPIEQIMGINRDDIQVPPIQLSAWRLSNGEKIWSKTVNIQEIGSALNLTGEHGLMLNEHDLLDKHSGANLKRFSPHLQGFSHPWLDERAKLGKLKAFDYPSPWDWISDDGSGEFGGIFGDGNSNYMYIRDRPIYFDHFNLALRPKSPTDLYITTIQHDQWDIQKHGTSYFLIMAAMACSVFLFFRFLPRRRQWQYLALVPFLLVLSLMINQLLRIHWNNHQFLELEDPSLQAKTFLFQEEQTKETLLAELSTWSTLYSPQEAIAQTSIIVNQSKAMPPEYVSSFPHSDDFAEMDPHIITTIQQGHPYQYISFGPSLRVMDTKTNQAVSPVLFAPSEIRDAYLHHKADYLSLFLVNGGYLLLETEKLRTESAINKP